MFSLYQSKDRKMTPYKTFIHEMTVSKMNVLQEDTHYMRKCRQIAFQQIMEFNTDFGWLTKWEKLSNIAITWEYNCFSLLLATWDVLPGGMSAPQRQKFHTDDVNQGLLNKSGSHGVPNVNLFDFMFLLVDYGKVLCSTANEVPQMLFPKRNIFQKYWLICITFITFTTQGRGGYLGKFLLGMCCWPLRAPALL